MRDLTLRLLFVLVLIGVLAFSWLKYQREIAAQTAGAELGRVRPPWSEAPSSVKDRRE